MHTVVLAVEFDGSQYDNMALLFELINTHANSCDKINRNVRTVTGKPLFTQKMAELIKKELETCQANE